MYMSYTRRAGTFRVKIQLVVTENTEEYEGLSSIMVNMPATTIIEKCLVKEHGLLASGSTYYGYTATDVSNWCNSYSNSFSNNTYNNGNVYYRQFEGITFEGSFYFNNITYLSSYTFARAWNGTGVSDTGKADLYFPNAIVINDRAFYCDGNLKSINAPNCISIGDSAFFSCGKMTEVSFPKCEIISGSSAFGNCDKLISINFPECSFIGN